jgi:hypothetical protein
MRFTYRFQIRSYIIKNLTAEQLTKTQRKYIQLAITPYKVQLTGSWKVNPEDVSLSKFMPASRAFVLNSYCHLNALLTKDVTTFRWCLFNQLAHADCTTEGRSFMLGFRMRQNWRHGNITFLPSEIARVSFNVMIACTLAIIANIQNLTLRLLTNPSQPMLTKLFMTSQMIQIKTPDWT